MVTNFIYPINSRADYFLVGENGNRLAITPEHLWDEIERSSPARVDPFVLTSSFNVMAELDRVWVYSVDAQKIVALGEAQRIYQDGCHWYVDLLWQKEVTASLRREPLPRGHLWNRIQSPARANPRTSLALDARLARRSSSTPDTDPLADERKRVMRQVVARQGQGAFRQTMLEVYNRRCAITGETCEAVLDAAHIDPYRGRKTNVASNGLLLRTDLHTLFDLGLLQVDRDYRARVGDSLDGTAYAKLDGVKIYLPARKSQRPSPAALERRRRSHP